MKGGVPRNSGVVTGARRFTTSRRKNAEEAGRQRAAQQGNGTRNRMDAVTTNGLGGGAEEDETAREESKGEEADRVPRYIVHVFSFGVGCTKNKNATANTSRTNHTHIGIVTCAPSVPQRETDYGAPHGTTHGAPHGSACRTYPRLFGDYGRP